MSGVPGRFTEEYVEQVLSLVERIPSGRVMTYGSVARAVGVGGPRLVGRVMSTYGGGVPWWRVVRADGGAPLPGDPTAGAQHRAESTPLRVSGRVLLSEALWWPPEVPDPDPGLSVPGGEITW